MSSQCRGGAEYETCFFDMPFFACNFVVATDYDTIFSEMGKTIEQSEIDEVVSSYHMLVDNYLSPYLAGYSKETLDISESTDERLGRYVVKDGKLYVRGTECKAISSLIPLLLSQKESLPDLDFLYLHAAGGARGYHAPVFCQCKIAGIATLIPFHDRIISMGEVPKFPHNNWEKNFEHIMTSQINWDDRLDQLIWRGGNDHYNDYSANIFAGVRGTVCYLSTQFPELIDARFASAESMPAILCDPIYKGDVLSIEEQLDYKFQIIMHGAAGTFPGTRWRLATGAVCFFS